MHTLWMSTKCNRDVIGGKANFHNVGTSVPPVPLTHKSTYEYSLLIIVSKNLSKKI